MVDKEGRELKVGIVDVVGDNRKAVAAAAAECWRLVAVAVKMPWRQQRLQHNHGPVGPLIFNKICF